MTTKEKHDKPEGEKAKDWRDELNDMRGTILSKLEQKQRELEEQESSIAAQQSTLQEQRQAVQGELETVKEELKFYRMSAADIRSLSNGHAAAAEPPVTAEVENAPLPGALEGMQPVAAGAAAEPAADLSDLHGVEPKSLDDYCLLVLNNTAEPLTIVQIQEAVLKAGYSTKSGDFKSVVYAATGRLSKAKKAKSNKDTGRTVVWSITALGKRSVGSMIAAAAKKQPPAAGNVDQLVLKFMQQKKGTIRAVDAVTAIIENGYRPANPETFAEEVSAALTRLSENNLISLAGKEGTHKLWTLTPAGIEEPVNV